MNAVHKILGVICFLCISFVAYSQEDYEEDSTYYEDDFSRDTTSTKHMGFFIGLTSQALLITPSNPEENKDDSISFNSSSPEVGFVLGLVFDKDLGDRFWLRTGTIISISKLNINHEHKEVTEDYTFNYSTLEIPIWGQYAFKHRRKGLSWGAGFTPSIDISKRVEVNTRLYELSRMDLLFGTGPGFAWDLPTGSIVNLALVFNVGLTNLFTDSDNGYNRSIDQGRRYQIQLLLGIN